MVEIGLHLSTNSTTCHTHATLIPKVAVRLYVAECSSESTICLR